MFQSNIIVPSKPLIKNAKMSWPYAPAIKQNFGFPDSIIYYISKNPSTPEIYVKLAKSCKYFFEKNPILVIERIHTGGKLACRKTIELCAKKNHKCCVKFDIAKLSSKIWLTNTINFSSLYIPNFVPVFVSKIYRCEEAELDIISKTITLYAFKLFATKFQNFHLDCARVINNDGSTVMLEDILESIQNVKDFNHYFHREAPAATASTLKNILKLQNLDHLSTISLYNIPEIVNVDDLDEFIKSHKNTKIWLSFCSTISEEYKKKLEKLVDTVINSGVENRLIYYAEQNEENLEIMQNHFTF